MLKAIAIDDEPPALNVITAFCKKVDFVDLQRTFTNTDDAFLYLSNSDVNLIFLDINMPAISGIDFYKRLTKKPLLILTTAFSEFALDGFNLSAVDYLLKPFTFDRFSQALEKARTLYRLENNNSSERFITLRINYSLERIALNDILYIEGLDDYLKVYLKQNKTLVARLTMKAMIEKLPADEFVRVHRSYIVSLSKVESMRNKMITIAGEEIPVSSSYEPAFLSLFKK